jgi:predicted lipoprotein with Yx(FWY)xxD motif
MRGVSAADVPAQVRLRDSGAGQFLTDVRGMTLYTYGADSTLGKSSCVAECAKHWPPLRAPAAAVAAGDWSLIARDDGAQQWAWRGQPLYGYDKDSYIGSMLGDGVANEWHVALQKIEMPPGFAIRSTFLGWILSTSQGQSLYWARNERAAADDDLSAHWQPVYAPWMAQPRGDWTLSARSDGQKQWTFRGRRLFSNTEDLKPGDTAGVQQSTDWEVAVLVAAPPLPAWVTVQSSDMGEVFADARGHTLYILAGQLDKIRQVTCDDDCIRRNWQTIPAAADARPSGHWTVVASPLGGAGPVWGYRGNALFTHSRDKEPGAIGGDRWGSGGANAGAGWTPVLRRRDLEQ